MTSAPTPPPHIRQARFADAEQCGRVCYEAFAAIADQHGFPHDFPSVDAATAACASILGNPRFFGVVAEHEGRVIGSNFLDERSTIYSVGPITVEPRHQDNRVGRELMQAVLARAEQQGVPNVRLVQAGYHTRSLSLYAKLGFTVREPLATLTGERLDFKVDGRLVRPAAETDVATCESLCVSVHGHARGGELRESVAQGAANVVENQGRITGYSTGIGFFSHAVAETNDDLTALIGAAHGIHGPGLLLPMRNTELLRWCLERGLRVVHTMNLMTMGQYQEPRAPYLASIGY
jgi:predicted N-acetyltransferase YhbS